MNRENPQRPAGRRLPRRYRPLVICACVLLAPVWSRAQTVKEFPKSRNYVTAGVYEEGGELHFERVASAAQTLGDWRVIGQPVGDLIGLARPGADGTELRILDATGRQVGTGKVPAGRAAIVTDKNVITLEEALHGPLRSHQFGFYSLGGVLLRDVNDPSLRLAKWSPQKDGRLVTVSQGPAPDERTIIVYAPDGQVAWRYATRREGYPDVTVTPDNQRLVLLDHDLAAGTSELMIMAPGNKILQTHHLPNLYEIIASDDSQRIAAVGQHVVVLLDAGSGNLLWRKSDDIDLALPGGVRFDPATQSLLIVAAQRDRDRGVSHLSLRTLNLANGDVERADLGEGKVDQALNVVDIGAAPAGQRQVILHDRAVDVPPDAFKPQ